MADDNVTFDFIGRQLAALQADRRADRAELADMRRVTLQVLDLLKRIERRLDDLRDDIGTAVTLEMGRAMLRFEERLERIEEKE